MIAATELETLTAQCRAIENKSEQEQFYTGHVFPVVRQVVVTQEQQKYPVPISHLILTLGFSAEPVILSILILRPEKVYLLYTGKGGSETILDRVVQESGLRISQIEKDEIDDTNVPDIYQKVKNIYNRWGQPADLTVDITGGKKSMVGACTLAACLLGARVVYLDSRYDSRLNKPLPGSEHLLVLDNPYDVFGDIQYQRAIGLFEQLDYTGAAKELEELCRETSSPEQYQARALLCQAYAAWDDWRIQEAQQKFQDLVSQIERFMRLSPNTPLRGQLPLLKAQADVLNRLSSAQSAFEKGGSELEFLKQPALFQTMLGSLRAGALRLERRQKLDTAALLWYRAIELMNQQRLARHGLSTQKADYTSAGLLRESLKVNYNRIWKTIKGNPDVDLPEEIDLTHGYALLLALKDPWSAAMPHLGRLRDCVQARNKSQFAHGFMPMSTENYVKIQKIALELFESFRKVEPDSSDDWDVCEFIASL